MGVRVTPAATSEVHAEVERWVQDGERGYICCANVHVIDLARTNARVARALEDATIVVPDGVPVAWTLSRKLGQRVPRVSGSDLVEVLCRSAIARKHFFYGSTPEILASLVRKVETRFPGIDVVGSYSPPFRPLELSETDDVTARINSADPDVVWVGLGAPKQEQWMHEFRPRLDAAALVGVGAVFEFLSGARRRAPVFVQRAGLEWLFRLGQEPRRLFARYAATNTSFLIALLKDQLR